jgi:hypothetical protein
VLTARRWLATCGLVLVAVLVGACGEDIVEAGPEGSSGSGFVDVIVTSPPTSASTSTTIAGTGGATTSTPTSGSGGAPTTRPGATTTAPVASPTFEAGQCLTWDPSAANVVFELVDCGDEHLIEIAGSGDLSEAFGPDAPFPELAQLQAAVDAACGPVVVEYLGRQVPDDVEAGVIPPTRDAWAQGDRVVWCTVGKQRENGARVPYTGRLANR